MLCCAGPRVRLCICLDLVLCRFNIQFATTSVRHSILFKVAAKNAEAAVKRMCVLARYLNGIEGVKRLFDAVYVNKQGKQIVLEILNPYLCKYMLGEESA